MAIEPLHTFLAILTIIIGGTAITWIYSSLKNQKDLKFSTFLGYFTLGLSILLFSNMSHFVRELGGFQFLGSLEKLPEFILLILGYTTLILGVKKAVSSPETTGFSDTARTFFQARDRGPPNPARHKPAACRSWHPQSGLPWYTVSLPRERG